MNYISCPDLTVCALRRSTKVVVPLRNLLFSLRQPFLLAAFVTSVWLTSTHSSHAATAVWTGSGADTNWQTTSNWTNGAGAGGIPAALDTLSFGGTGGTQGTTSINNFAAATQFNGILFTNDASSNKTAAFTLGSSGASITLGGNITTTANASATTTTITDSIDLNLILNGTRTVTTTQLSATVQHNLTINGLISEVSGAQGLLKTGAAILTLSNAGNSFTGAMTIQAGTLSVNSLASSGQNSAIGAGSSIILGGGNATNTGIFNYTGSAAGSTTINRSITLASTGTGGGSILNNGTGGALVFTGTFTNLSTSGANTFGLGGNSTGANDFQSTLVNGGGTMGLAKTNTGTWTVSGNNTFTGLVTINQGTLIVTTIADAGSSNLGLGTTLRLGSTNTTGTLSYTGSGTTTVRTLQIGNNSGTPAVTETGGATIQSNGTGALIFSASTFNAQQTNAATGAGANRVLTLGGTNTAGNQISGIIQNNIVSGTATGTALVGVTKADAGRWILAGANSYTGTTTVSAGVLQLSGATSLPGGIGATGGLSALTLSGGVLGLGNGSFTRSLGTGATQVQFTSSGGFAAYGADRSANLGGVSAGVTWNTGSFIPASSVLILGSSTATHTVDFQNPINLADANRTVQIDDGAATVDAILSGAITSTTPASGILTKTGAGTLQLNSTGNAYTGGTTIESGTVRLGASGVIPDTGIVTIRKSTAVGATNGILDLAGFSETIGSITFGHTVTDINNAGQTPSVINSGGISALTLGGNVTYNPGTTSFGNGQATISATLDLTAGAHTFLINDSDQTTQEVTISSVIQSSIGTANLTKTGAGVLVFSGANTYSGNTTISLGTLQIGAGGTVPNGTGKGNLIFGAPLSTALFDLNGFDATINGLSQATASTTNRVVNNASGTNKTLTVGNADVTSTFAGIIADNTSGTGTLAITKTGAGTLTLSGTNTFSGKTIVGNGTLAFSIGNISATADQQLGKNTVLDLGVAASSSGTLLYTGSTSTLAKNINALGNGNNTIENNGGSTLTLSGILTKNGTALVLKNTNANSQIIVSNAITGANANSDLVISGGTTTLNADSTYNGPTSVTGSGTLQLGNGGTTGNIASSTSINLDTGATLKTNRSDSITLTQAITGAGNVEVANTSTGITALTSASNAYSGATTVTSGTLQVGSGGAGKTGTGAVTLPTGSVILGTGIVQGSSFTAASGSTIHVGDTTAQGSYGTLTFTPASGSGTFDFQSSSSTILGINSGGTSDLLSFIGTGTNTLLFNGNLTVGASAFVPVAVETFNLLDWAGLSSAPTFASRYNAVSYSGYLLGNGDDNLGFDLPDVFGSGYAWDISQFTTNGTISIVSVIPEPSRAFLLLIGLVGLVLRRRR